MTTRTTNTVKCQCGHIGQIHMRENDAPYSRQWEEYSVSNLNVKRDTFYVDGVATFQAALAHMEPSCPECGRAITVDNIVL